MSVLLKTFEMFIRIVIVVTSIGTIFGNQIVTYLEIILDFTPFYAFDNVAIGFKIIIAVVSFVFFKGKFTGDFCILYISYETNT